MSSDNTERPDSGPSGPQLGPTAGSAGRGGSAADGVDPSAPGGAAAADPDGAPRGPGPDRHGAPHPRRRWPVLPVVLVAIGVVWLLGNLGVGLGRFWGWVGDLLALWPVVLIAIGADLLTRGKYRLLIASVTVGVMVVGATYGWLGGARGGTVEQVAVPAGGATSLHLYVGAGLDSLELRGAQRGDDAVWGSVRLGRDERLDTASQVRGGILNASVATQATTFSPFLVRASGGEMRLNVDPRLVTDLEIDAGVGSVDLELTAMTLSGLDVDGGVGSMTVRLPRSGSFRGELDLGVGSVVIEVPQSLALQLDVSTGVGRVSVDGAFTKRGDSYLSPAAGQAATAHLTVEAGVGGLTIRSVLR